MNHTTRYLNRLSALLLVGASLYLGGCGPEYLDDAASIEAKDDMQQMHYAKMENPAHHAENMKARAHVHMDSRMDNRAMAPVGDAAVGAQAVVAAPVAAAVVAPIPVVEFPDAI